MFRKYIDRNCIVVFGEFDIFFCAISGTINWKLMVKSLAARDKNSDS